MKLLYVDCCISVHERSRTKLLADTFLSAWRAAHPQDEIEVLDIKPLDLPPLKEEALRRREEALHSGRTDAPEFALARQFAAAERIVVATPLWELSFPSQLRLYIEHIAAAGITFGYTAQGEVGLCRAKKLLFLTTAGGPLEGRNCGSDYWRALCPFFGISEYHFLGAAMQDVIEIDHEYILQGTLQEAQKLALTF